MIKNSILIYKIIAPNTTKLFTTLHHCPVPPPVQSVQSEWGYIQLIVMLQEKMCF